MKKRQQSFRGGQATGLDFSLCSVSRRGKVLGTKWVVGHSPKWKRRNRFLETNEVSFDQLSLRCLWEVRRRRSGDLLDQNLWPGDLANAPAALHRASS